MNMTDRGWCDYEALNLNCGCPSPKVVGKGCLQAAHMDNPKLVSELTKAMHEGCDRRLPITMKCWIGTNTHEPFSQTGYAKSNPKVKY
jgi:tRNA-dihydrouridine synthase A